MNKTKTKKTDKVKSDKVKKTNPWLEHIKKVREKHPEMKYKDVLVEAKKSYVRK